MQSARRLLYFGRAAGRCLIITFEQFGLTDEILKSLSDMGFDLPTPVQEQVIPLMLDGRDVLAQAPTGTGKTCAFGIPSVRLTEISDTAVQTLVLCPTRELARQIEAELKRIAANTKGVSILSVYGGQNIERQFAGLRKKPRIVVGTPGRIIDHINRGTLKLDGVRRVVLDEADEMLDMGFREDIDFILTKTSALAQTVMFSATIPKEIAAISRNYQSDTVFIKTETEQGDLPDIRQFVCHLKEADKLEAFKRIMHDENLRLVLCFCNTKHKSDALAKKMQQENILAECIHGDLRQRQRDTVMKEFRDRQINVLVATDVAARGIDVDGVDAVINYDVPQNEDYYVHRIGRTARANKEGASYTFAQSSDAERIRLIQKRTKIKMDEYVIDGVTQEFSDKKKSKKSDGIRFFVNLGKKDGLDAFGLNKLMGLGDKNATFVYDTKILDTFSFVEVEKGAAELVTALNGSFYNGRKISVEKTRQSGENVAGEKTQSSARQYGARKPQSGYGARSDRGLNQRGDKKQYSKPAQKAGRSYGDDNQKVFKSKSEKGYIKTDKAYKGKAEKSFDSQDKPYSKAEKRYGEKSEGKFVKTENGYGKPKKAYSPKTEKVYSSKADKSYSAKTEKAYGSKTENGFVEKAYGKSNSTYVKDDKKTGRKNFSGKKNTFKSDSSKSDYTRKATAKTSAKSSLTRSADRPPKKNKTF